MKHPHLRRFLALGLSALLAVPIFATPASAAGGGDEPLTARPSFTVPAEGGYVPDQLLVLQKTDPAARYSRAGTAFTSDAVVGSQTVYDLDLEENYAPGGVSLFSEEKSERYLCTLVDLAPGSDLEAAAQALYADPTVTAVAPNSIVHVEQTPATPAENDIYERSQSWLTAIHAYDAWDTLADRGIEPGAGVTVAVVDSGVDEDHPDLKGRLVSNGDTLFRYYYMDENGDVSYSNDVCDENDHGTHVSGAVLGERNGTGTVGVAPGAKLLPIRVFGDEGGADAASILAGVQYAVNLKHAAVSDEGWGTSDLPAKPSDDAVEDLKNLKVINMSLGGVESSDQQAAIYDPVYRSAREAGILTVVAAGNENLPTVPTVGYEAYYSSWVSPASSPWAFAVMATNERAAPGGDQLVNFSNWDADPGEGAEYQLMAPGTDILSTIPRGYGLMSGTSMASPVTAGTAALLMSAYPDADVSDIWNALINVDKAQGRTDFNGNSWSYPSLDAAASLKNLEENKTPEAAFDLALAVDSEEYRPLLNGLGGNAIFMDIDRQKLCSTVELLVTCYSGEMTSITVQDDLLSAEGAYTCSAGEQIRIPLTVTNPQNLTMGYLPGALTVVYTDAADQGEKTQLLRYELDAMLCASTNEGEPIAAQLAETAEEPQVADGREHLVFVVDSKLNISGSATIRNAIFYFATAEAEIAFSDSDGPYTLNLESCRLLAAPGSSVRVDGRENTVNLNNCLVSDFEVALSSVEGCTFQGGETGSFLFAAGDVTDSAFQGVMGGTLSVYGSFTGNLVSDCFDGELYVMGDVTHNTFLGAYTQAVEEDCLPLTVHVMPTAMEIALQDGETNISAPQESETNVSAPQEGEAAAPAPQEDETGTSAPLENAADTFAIQDPAVLQGSEEDPPSFRKNAVVGPLLVREASPITFMERSAKGINLATVGENFYLFQGIDENYPVPYLQDGVEDKLNCANWDEAVRDGTITTLRSVKGMDYPENLPSYLDDCPPFLLNLSGMDDIGFLQTEAFLPYDCTAMFSTAMDTDQETAATDAMPYAQPFIDTADLEWSGDGKSCTFQRCLTGDCVETHIAFTIYGLQAESGSSVASALQYFPSLECWLTFQANPNMQIEKTDDGLTVSWDDLELDPWVTGDMLLPNGGTKNYKYMSLSRTNYATEEMELLKRGLIGSFDTDDETGRFTYTDEEAGEIGTTYLYEVKVTSTETPEADAPMAVYGWAEYLDPGEHKLSFDTEQADLRAGGATELTLTMDSGAVLEEGERLDVTLTCDPSLMDVEGMTGPAVLPWVNGVSRIDERTTLLSVGPDYDGSILLPGDALCSVTLKGVSAGSGTLSATVKAVELDDETQVRDLGSTSCNITVSSSGSGGGGGSSTTTNAEKNEDGSTTKTVTNKSTGTVTETTTWPDGRKQIVETKKDGTVTTTETRQDGYKSVTILAPDGSTSVEIRVPKDDLEVVSTGDGKGTTTAAITAKGPATVTIPVKDAGPGTVAVLVGADGTRTILPGCVASEDGMILTVDGSCKLEIVDNTKTFADAAAGTWYAAAVTFVTARELFNGTAEGTFSPDLPMSRAMLFTVLARMDGQDTTGGDTWYAKAMDWAKSAGISDGTNPDGSITREQLATMLYRYAGSPATAGTLNGFTDADEAGSYATDALKWAVEQGIITGKTGGVLDPKGEATRAQVAAMLMRYLVK